MFELIEDDLFKFAWCRRNNLTFDDYVEELKKLAVPEDWGDSNKILKNYLSFTYRYMAKAQNTTGENYIVENSEKKIACFNTGLFSVYYEPIYAYFRENHVIRSHSPKWFLVGFKVASDYELNDFENLPNRMNYFKNASDLVFDYRLDVRVNVPHILGDEENMKRLPDNMQSLDRVALMQRLSGAVDIAKKMASSNYSIAVPQFYQGSLQLLLPIYFSDSGKPDLALAVNKRNNIYSGRTCLTYEMAYNNARLICKPDSAWLKPY